MCVVPPTTAARNAPASFTSASVTFPIAAHQAVYTDDAMAAGDRDWAISGVSLRSPDVRDALQPQDGLYSVTERDTAGERMRVIGSVREVLVGGEDAERIIAALASPHVHIASLHGDGEGLPPRSREGLAARDCDGPGPRPARERSAADDLRIPGAWLWRVRRAAGLPGMTLMSCDNLASNGRQLAALLDEFLERRDPSPRAVGAARERLSVHDGRSNRTRHCRRRRRACRSRARPRRSCCCGDRELQSVGDRGLASPVRARGGKRAARDSPLTCVRSRRPSCGCSTAHIPRSRTSGSAWGLEHVHQAIADPDLNALVRRIMKEGAASLTAGARTRPGGVRRDPGAAFCQRMPSVIA